MVGEITMVITQPIFLLPKKDRLMLIIRYGLYGIDEHTLDDLGLLFGVSRERIRQIEAKSLRRLRYYRRVQVTGNSQGG